MSLSTLASAKIVNILYPGEYMMLPVYFNFHMSSCHRRKMPLICYMDPLVSLSVMRHVSYSLSIFHGSLFPLMCIFLVISISKILYNYIHFNIFSDL